MCAFENCSRAASTSPSGKFLFSSSLPPDDREDEVYDCHIEMLSLINFKIKAASLYALAFSVKASKSSNPSSNAVCAISNAVFVSSRISW